MNYLLTWSFLLITFTTCLTHALTQEEKNYIAKHSVDESTASVLDIHADDLSKKVMRVHDTPLQKHGVWTFSWLPGYYVKYNISRVFNCEKIRTCIEEFGLDLMHAPEKKLYHIKGRPFELTSLNYLVIIPKVKASRSADARPLNLKHVEQFVTIIKHTGHISTARGNYLRIAPDAISFIDTDGTFNRERALTGVLRLFEHRNLNTYYTSEALRYLFAQAAKMFASLNPTKREEQARAIRKLGPAISAHILTRSRRFL